MDNKEYCIAADKEGGFDIWPDGDEDKIQKADVVVLRGEILLSQDGLDMTARTRGEIIFRDGNIDVTINQA